MVLLAVIAGFTAGLFHVLSGPDHLAAVAPLAVNKGRAGWRTGLEWAVGHCTGVLLIGVLALLLRELLPVDLVSSWAEKLVGLILIGIGAWGICKTFMGSVQVRTPAAFMIGTVHGFAGSSHLLGVVPALLFPGPVAAGGYFIGFSAGTIVGMAAFSSVIAALPQRFFRTAMVTSSSAAMLIGCYWLIG